jgi:hypothetical protein
MAGKTVGHMASVLPDTGSGIRFMSRPAAGGMRIGFYVYRLTGFKNVSPVGAPRSQGRHLGGVCGAASPIAQIVTCGMSLAPFRLSARGMYQAVSNCSNMTSEEQQ